MFLSRTRFAAVSLTKKVFNATSFKLPTNSTMARSVTLISTRSIGSQVVTIEEAKKAPRHYNEMSNEGNFMLFYN